MTHDDNLRQWVGRSETASERIAAAPANRLNATLDREADAFADGDPLPPAWHWLYAAHIARQSALGPDGHAARGGFLPPIPLPRRMWAGGRMIFERPLLIGERLTRRSLVEDVTSKQGRSGALVFCLVRHEIAGEDGVATIEEHDIVYRDAPDPDEAIRPGRAAPAESQWRRTVEPDPVMLFRFSALTFNGHRIHYDRPYTTETEGYPGLVVHGPLIAILLLDLVREVLPEARLRSFDYKAESPLFDTAPFSVAGLQASERLLSLWAENAEGRVAMSAEARIE